MTTANKITIGRILLIPVFVLLAIYYGESVRSGQPDDRLRWAAVIVFVVAAGSDALDGYIARRFQQRSRLGVILDPLADKALLVAALGSKLTELSKGSPLRFLILSLVAVCFMSAFINNTPVVVVFIPAVLTVCTRLGQSPSKFLMPISFVR